MAAKPTRAAGVLLGATAALLLLQAAFAAQTWNGRLGIGLVHNQDGTSGYSFTLRPRDGNVTRTLVLDAPVTFLPPTYFTGSRVNVTGALLDSGNIRVAGLKDIRLVPGITPKGWAWNPETSMRVLFILVNTPCGNSPASQSGVQDMLRRLNNVWSSCSFGKLTVDLSGSRVVTYNAPSCGNCESLSNDQFRDSAVAWARQAGINPDAFPYHAYALPSGSCSWSGKALVRCRDQSSWGCWATYVGNGATSLSLNMHEAGHNLGLHHSRNFGETNEYGDITDPMGDGPAICYNAPHLHQMRWITPSVLDAASLPVGQVRTVQSAATAVSANSAVRINVNSWAAGQDSVYLAFLVKQNGLAGLADQFAGRTAIHRWAGNGWDDGHSHITAYVSSIGVGQTYTFNAPLNLAIRHLSTVGATATLQICRFSGSASQCNFGTPPPPTPVPPPPTTGSVNWALTMYEHGNYGGSWVRGSATWTAPGAAVWSVPSLGAWANLNDIISSFKYELTCNGGANCPNAIGQFIVVFYEHTNFGGRAFRWQAGAPFDRYCSGNTCSAFVSWVGWEQNDMYSSFRVFMGGALPSTKSAALGKAPATPTQLQKASNATVWARAQTKPQGSGKALPVPLQA